MSFASKNDIMEHASQDANDGNYKIGTVVANNDPLALGRIQCSVPDLFDPTQGDVPWIGSSKSSPFGMGPGWGWYGSPAVGSKVRIELQNDDPHYPIYVADEYVSAIANAVFADPMTWGFVDPAGNKLFVNMTTGDWQFTHQSGSSLFWNTEGDVTLTVVGKLQANVTGTANVTSTGAMTLHSSGAVNISGATVNLNP